jgi:membrane carboxypeptidase/penicillin-binding protein
VIDDSPVQIQLASNKTWEPKNYDQQFRGPVTVREAFEKSLNVPAVKVASDVGVDRVQDMWHNAGIEGDLSATPAIALGVNDVSMRELVSAYSMFPNLGTRTEPHLIDKVETTKGGEMYHYDTQGTQVIDPDVAYVMHTLMRGVVMRGTAASLNQSGLGYAAGKTGTTSNYRDAWFVGYTPDLLTAVWVGFDDGTPIRISSGEAAVPIWAMYMTRAPHSDADIRPPGGVSMVEVEAQTGRVWQQGCGPSVVEAYLSGTEPREPCGGYYDGSQMIGIYEEPPMYNDQMAMPDYSSPSEIVIDPADTAAMDSDTALYVEPDTVTFEQSTIDTLRAREERRRRERQQAPPPPPIIAPPARLDTPIVRPSPPPPTTPPPDSTPVDSLYIH